MTIETYCNNCGETISTLFILVGQLHPDNTLSMSLEESSLICSSCDERDISLRLVGGTAKFGSNREDTQA
jgi:hypothetical protein